MVPFLLDDSGTNSDAGYRQLDGLISRDRELGVHQLYQLIDSAMSLVRN